MQIQEELLCNCFLSFISAEGIDDKGVPYEVNDPGLSDRDQDLIKSDNPLDFLNLSCFADVDLSLSKQFVDWYLKWYKRIEEKGILNTMEELLV